VADWYDEGYYGRSPAADPRGPAHGKQRVARGGPGFINPRVLRISSRLRVEPDAQRIFVGFRCARDAE
jgi:formylglycine-generating enzyme required for sulfatase activity